MMYALILALALAAEPSSDAEAGVDAFAEGRYEDAAEILERAYASAPDPALLFAWAQAERYAGHCNVAVPLYRRYLEDQPPADVRGLARDAIAACGEDPDRKGEVEPSAEPAVAPRPSLAPAAEPPTAPPRPAARDPWGHALTWPGLVVAGVGAGLLGEAHRRRMAGEEAIHEQAYRDALRGAPALSRAGIGLLAGGGALLVGGVIRWAVVAARGRSTGATTPKPYAAPSGRRRAAIGGFGVVWRFELAPRRGRALP